MSENKQRQINIRDDEIYERAHHIALRLGVPMKEAVRRALRAFSAEEGAAPASDPAVAYRLEELRAVTKRISKKAVKRTHAEDDAALYCADGLPR
ncbi:MAG: type II toxin-antitoxin system VapB family antitoxin [Pseudomonadota bacterium]